VYLSPLFAVKVGGAFVMTLCLCLVSRSLCQQSGRGRGLDGNDDGAGVGSSSGRHGGRAFHDENGRNFGRGGLRVTPPQGRGGCFRNRAVDAKWPENPNTLNISYIFKPNPLIFRSMSPHVEI
jgi:hypothetical protein